MEDNDWEEINENYSRLICMCFWHGDVLYYEHNDAKGGLRKIGEFIYVKDVDEPIVHGALPLQF